MTTTTALLGAATRLATGRATCPGGVVLAYHDVVAGDPVTRYDVTTHRLREHLGLLRSLGFRVVPLTRIVELAATGHAEGMAALTFDDALGGVGRLAAPIRQEHGAAATVFAVSAGLGRAPEWWPEAAPTMTPAELREWHAAGFAVGSHTRTHRSLVGLADAALAEELAGSRGRLEDLLGTTVQTVAYPYGHHDRSVRTAAAAAGYTAGFAFLNGRLTGREDPFRLPRLTIGAHHDRARLAYHLGRAASSWPDHQCDRVDGRNR